MHADYFHQLEIPDSAGSGLEEHMLCGSGLVVFVLVEIVQCCVLCANALLVIVDSHVGCIFRIQHG